MCEGAAAWRCLSELFLQMSWGGGEEEEGLQ